MAFNTSIILRIIILSLLPISELRGGIPIGLAFGLNLFLVYFVCVFFNILVFPIFYLFLSSLHKFFMNFRFYKRTFDMFLEKTRKRAHRKIEKYGYLGLTLFVAIPLPITGAYTGTLAAWFFEMDKKKSFLAVALGVIIAGIIVTLVSLFGIKFFDVFIKNSLK